MRISNRDLRRMARVSRGRNYGLHLILGIIGLIIAGSNLAFGGNLIGMNVQIPGVVTDILLLIVSLFTIFMAFKLHRM